MDGRCKDCRWWREDEGDADEPFWCANDKLYRYSQDGVHYSRDSSGYLITGPEFGCIHFEPKD
jgi:hypothetical protein